MKLFPGGKHFAGREPAIGRIEAGESGRCELAKNRGEFGEKSKVRENEARKPMPSIGSCTGNRIYRDALSGESALLRFPCSGETSLGRERWQTKSLGHFPFENKPAASQRNT